MKKNIFVVFLLNFSILFLASYLFNDFIYFTNIFALIISNFLIIVNCSLLAFIFIKIINIIIDIVRQLTKNMNCPSKRGKIINIITKVLNFLFGLLAIFISLYLVSTFYNGFFINFNLVIKSIILALLILIIVF